jgi:ferritin-like metal-binding protein YciE
MAAITLRDLYAAELHDLMNAEKQIVEELPLMAGRATAARLQRALEDHHRETKIQVERLQLLLQQLNEPAREVPSGAIAAMLEDVRRRLHDTERGETLDAALVAAAQQIEHWEIASYGTARSYAETLGDYDAARLLQQTLDEEGHTDQVLTKLAERGINQAAGDDLLEQSTRYRSRLRFMSASDVPALNGRDVPLHNDEGDLLGTLDGFVVDSESTRPVYYVIDSRGWFAGRRYVVPVGQVEADAGATALRTELTRAELARYPEFSPSAFTAMDDRDAVRYERRLHRAFVPDSRAYSGRPQYEDLPAYRPPTWLMTGVWTSDASGFAVTPPRADSDASIHSVEPPKPATGARERTADPEGELVIAREEGESDAKPPREPESRRDAQGQPREREDGREQPEPRIERYRER